MEFSQKFVSASREFTTFEKGVPAPLFRLSFSLDAVPVSRIRVCGLGFYRLFVNGAEITKGYLAPYISNTDHIAYYDDYDLTDALTVEENVVGIALGNGLQSNIGGFTWDFDKAVYRSAPKLAVWLEVGEGEEACVWEAPDFVCAESGIWFDDLRSGVFMDARKEPIGWNKPGFDASGWKTPFAVERPRGRAELCRAEPLRPQGEIIPFSVTESHGLFRTNYPAAVRRYVEAHPNMIETDPCEDGWLYDFGVNETGTVRLKVKGHAGQKISLQFGEILRDGKLDYSNIRFMPSAFDQRDIYICRGDGEEIWEVPFTYHGARYCHVSGITKEQATPELLTFVRFRSDLTDRASFSCSDETVNTLWEMARRSDFSNFVYFPNDCPHREKNGWTGDAACSAEHMILTMTPENSYDVWLDNIRLAQKEDGMLPGIVPSTGWGYAWGNGPAWDIVLFALPYVTFRYRGETEIIRKNAHAMVNYIDYAYAHRDEKGLFDFGLGDWVPVGNKPDALLTPRALTNTIMILEMLRMGSVMFRAVDDTVRADWFDTLRTGTLRDLRAAYLDEKTKKLGDGNQTAQAMGLYYGIFTEDEEDEAFARLLDAIDAAGGNFDVGHLGLRTIFHVLAAHGKADLALSLITKKEYPSYGHLIELGETTLPEQFMPDGMPCGSHNHHFFGDIRHFFLRHLAGLHVNPDDTDPNFVMLRPALPDGLDEVRASYDVPAGTIDVTLVRNGSRAVLTVESGDEVGYSVEPAYGWEIDSIDETEDGKTVFTLTK